MGFRIDDVLERAAAQLTLIERKTLDDKVPSDNRLYEQYAAILPNENWEGVSLVNVFDEFRREFVHTLLRGGLQSWLWLILKQPESYGEVYVILSKAGSGNNQDRQLRRQFRGTQLDKQAAQLRLFLREVEEASVPQPYKQAYVDKVGEDLRLGQTARLVSSVRFTLDQEPAEQWYSLVDWPTSLTSGTIYLKYEHLARQLLASPSSNDQVLVEHIMNEWEVSDEERAYLKVSREEGMKGYLGEGASKRWLELLLHRAGFLSRYRVEKRNNIPAIRVDSRAGRIEIPDKRTLTADEMRYLGPHEIWHLGRSFNGANQGCSLWQVGLQGYLPTEEGGAVLTEMAFGRSFSHARQKLYAARYLAVALAVKTRIDQGELMAAFTYDDIFHTLRGYGLQPEIAAETVWRVARGTSLQRQVVTKQMLYQGETVDLGVAEVNLKDRVYLEGQVDLLCHLFGISTDDAELIDALFVKGGELIFRYLNLLSMGKVPIGVFSPQSDWRDYLVLDSGFSLNLLQKPRRDISAHG
jgi:hypothetical protein